MLVAKLAAVLEAELEAELVSVLVELAASVPIEIVSGTELSIIGVGPVETAGPVTGRVATK